MAGYSVKKLIDRQIHGDGGVSFSHHMICDIDKTYLETDFDTIYQLARTALEEAHEKRTVKGADAILRTGKWQSQGPTPNGLHFVSASPPQMREVLLEKMRLDDVSWDSAIFKDQTYNLRKGRVDLLRHHIGYKSAALHMIMASLKKDSRVVLIGDSVEDDCFVYRGFKGFLRGEVSLSGYLQYLELGGTDKDEIEGLKEVLTPLQDLDITQIYIRKVPGYPMADGGLLSTDVIFFDHFLEVGLDLIALGFIDPKALGRMLWGFHNQYNLAREELVALCMHAYQRRPSEPFFSDLAEGLSQIGIQTSLFKARLDAVKPYEALELTKPLSEQAFLNVASHWVQSARLINRK